MRAIQTLIETSQGHAHENDAAINISDEQKLCLNQVKSQMNIMLELNKANESIVNQINIISQKCQHDIGQLFESLRLALVSRQKELLTSLQKMKAGKLSTMSRRITDINDFIVELQQFNDHMYSVQSNDEPGQSLQEKKQKLVYKSLELSQANNVNDDIKMVFAYDNQQLEVLHAAILKLGNIDCAIHTVSKPPNAPILCIKSIKDITECSVRIMADFSNNELVSIPDKYNIEIAENKSNKEEDMKQGELNDMNMQWMEVKQCKINKNALNRTQSVIKDLKPGTNYFLQCKCANQYGGWSLYSKCISFKTMPKTIQMDTILLNGMMKELIVKALMKQLQVGTMELTLLYRASVDGFDGSQFHAKCDGKKKTIVIVKSSAGNVFGGYTTWTQDNKWHRDGTCFLFAWDNHKNECKIYPIKQSHANKAVKHYSGHGPCFGQGHDLLIVNGANKSASRSAGASFIDLKGDTLTGSKVQIMKKYWEFGISEYECFQISVL